MIQKDLNLFASLKKSSSKSGSSVSGLIGVIVSFVLLVGIAFGGLLAWEIALNHKADGLRAQMTGEDIKAEQDVFAHLSATNTKLSAYLSGAKEAGRRFSQIPKIDKTLLDAISSSLPGDTRINSMTASPPTVQLACVSGSELSPAAFQKTLLKKGLFKKVSYAGISAAAGGYSFTMSCVLDHEAILNAQK